MSDELITRTRAALEGVPEGPWTLDTEDGELVEHEHFHYDSTDTWYDVDGANGGWKAHCEDEATARFIAASRTLVPELLEAVIELDATLFQITEARIDYEAALRNREHGAVAADRLIRAVSWALDRHEKTSKTDDSVT